MNPWLTDKVLCRLVRDVMWATIGACIGAYTMQEMMRPPQVSPRLRNEGGESPPARRPIDSNRPVGGRTACDCAAGKRPGTERHDATGQSQGLPMPAPLVVQDGEKDGRSADLELAGPLVSHRRGGIPLSLFPLICAVGEVESSNNPYAVGDNGRSKGLIQCGRAAWKDGCEWGGVDWPYEKFVWSPLHSAQVFVWYTDRWGAKTDEQRARCWNSGSGWKKKYRKTDAYWRHVKERMR